MKKNRLPVLLLLVLVFAGAAMLVSAQEVPTLPVDVTLQVTLGVTIEATVVPPTAAPPTVPPTTVPATTVPSTAVATTQPTTSGATEQPTNSDTTATATLVPGTQAVTPEATVEMTAEAPVESEVEMAVADDSAFYRVAYLTRDGEAVDVYIDNVLIFRNLGFPRASRWIALNPGTHTVVITPHSEAVADAVIEPFVVDASAGVFTTIAIVSSGADDDSLDTVLVVEDYSDLLPGTGGFTFINARPDSPDVTLLRDAVAYFTQIGFGEFASLLVDSGVFDVRAVDADDMSMVIDDLEDLELGENTYTLVALTGGDRNPRFVRIVTDRADVEIARGTLPKPGRILEALRARDILMGFADLLADSNLGENMRSAENEYTVFVPANAVMEDAAAAGMDGESLQSYVVRGKYTLQDLIEAELVEAIDGTTLRISVEDNKIYVNGVQLIDVNVPATNGVIHVLSGWLEQ